ncbi:hypothetical protein G9A89_020255 [Geosiphon pyriformis]|nr:hypothetical protein G9A89_020255 [Geosiphon pyriformis]
MDESNLVKYPIAILHKTIVAQLSFGGLNDYPMELVSSEKSNAKDYVDKLNKIYLGSLLETMLDKNEILFQQDNDPNTLPEKRKLDFAKMRLHYSIGHLNLLT